MYQQLNVLYKQHIHLHVLLFSISGPINNENKIYYSLTISAMVESVHDARHGSDLESKHTICLLVFHVMPEDERLKELGLSAPSQRPLMHMEMS